MNETANPTTPPAKHGLAIASLVLGICAVVFSGIGLGIILGTLAIIFGALSIKSNKGKSLAGIITGGVGILFSLIALLFFVFILPVSMASLQKSQRDTTMKNDVASLVSDITFYMGNNQGALPDNEWVSGMTYKLDILSGTISGDYQTVDPSGTVGVYTTGVDCDGATGSRDFSVTIRLENGETYCQGS